jgi:hypothetical protein
VPDIRAPARVERADEPWVSCSTPIPPRRSSSKPMKRARSGGPTQMCPFVKDTLYPI